MEPIARPCTICNGESGNHFCSACLGTGSIRLDLDPTWLRERCNELFETAKTVRQIQRQRHKDEMEYAAGGQTYSITQLAVAEAALDAALAKVQPK